MQKNPMSGWRKIGSGTGTQSIPITETTGTYRVVAIVDTENMFTLDIVADHLTASLVYPQIGQIATTSSYIGVAMGATNTYIKGVQAYKNGTNVTNTLQFTIYHKAENYES